jgi:hypothetical protein
MVIVIVTLAIMLTSVSSANVRSTIPPDPYAPIYADWYGNEELVTFIFYRNPSCVPPDFNLLNFFDSPLSAFSCPLSVDGFVTYKNPDDFVPIQGKLRGLGVVPIWFVSREDYNTAKNDGVFTMGEFNSLSSLIKASAHFYTETLHPEGPSAMPMKNIEASGTLEDNSMGYRFFRLHIIWVGSGADPVVKQVKITFW